MRIIAVGDTHGRDTWERIAAANLWDKFVFIGDYFDSREGISAAVQLENFKNIVAFKKRAPGSVVLLVGNHDFHYLGGISARYSGHQELYASEIREALEAARDSLQICFAADGHLFTHAGVTKTWCASNGVLTNDIEAGLNDLFRQNAIAFKFTPGI
ncbi:MAG TPA: metallophosphoesterase, partial [Chitinophagales bacterium]|nr:metallophosphoesterase [Chitinophagales bacterium]